MLSCRCKYLQIIHLQWCLEAECLSGLSGV